jgi:ABC-type lipoprotein export system ATPase subunit
VTAPADSAAAIELRDVAFRYPGAEGFSLEINRLSVPEGDSVALVGPSGSGKATLLALLAGILRPSSGRIRVHGTDLDLLDDRRLRQFRIRDVGQVFQSFELLPYLSVVENVMLPRYIRQTGKSTRQSGQDAMQLLSEMGLAHKAHARPGELSQGEQQRVAVCRAMLNRPAILLADEPTGNLDQDNTQNVVTLLLDMARQHDSTLIMVTHDRSLLEPFSTVLDIQGVAAAGQGRQA